MQVSEVMTRGVRTLPPTDSVVQAAQAMQSLNVGAIPVCDGDTLVGMVTDRDLVLRGLAQRRGDDATPISDVMSAGACWCFDDQSVDDVARQMRDGKIRRMPVLDHDHRLVGIVSLGDLATKADKETAARALSAISSPSRPSPTMQSPNQAASGGPVTV